jgi:membrane fusion protein (multidrug efflux system)
MATTDAPHTAPPPPPAAAPSAGPAHPAAPVATTAGQPLKHPGRRRLEWIVGIIVAVVVIAAAIPWLIEMLETVSTDDAYVNGHVTFVAPRVAGQVTRVLVDDNNRVRKGDLLVQLDKEPFVVQVNIAKAALDAASANLIAVRAQTRATEAEMRSLRFNLEHAIEDVDNQIALLHSRVAALGSAEATVEKTKADYDRAAPLVASGAVTKEDLDRRKEALLVAQAQVEEAKQGAYQIRVGLGLPPVPTSGNLNDVPPDLDQDFSTVRQAQLSLAQAAAQIGYFDSLTVSPSQMVKDFYAQDPQGNLDRIYVKLLKNAPGVKLAETQLMEAQANLDQANLNLRYTDIVAEIDGVITRRDVNAGNNVVVGQSLMAIRALTPPDIWVDANFKETQLKYLRIGQKVELDVDTYGSRHLFEGRISGFTMGTGSTLALLPAENATGNFVKVVQRLPVRIDLVGYNPDVNPLFIGLSVTPRVLIDEEPTGPDAGKVLQPYAPKAAMDSAAYVAPAPLGTPATAPATPETQP